VELRTLIEEFLEEGVSGLEGTELSQVVGIVVLVLSLIFGIGSLTASHPIMPFRVRAILDPSKKSGRLL
jgi:hypothetical protein